MKKRTRMKGRKNNQGNIMMKPSWKKQVDTEGHNLKFWSHWSVKNKTCHVSKGEQIYENSMAKIYELRGDCEISWQTRQA